ncbi:MAG TPA: hypothetical protein VN909_05060 [Candidatus Dormibacteraeota bacterium]|nr:hypothetical protein [Candidatus Dormibacteraeota bacterium]
MKAHFTILTAAVALFGATAVASAQGAPPPPGAPYSDTNCGSWQGDTWAPNGNCPTAYKHEVVAGTIVSVKGHLVTLQQTTKQVVIDDSSALSNQNSGRVAVGRQIVAHGYWQGENFYATAITGGQPPPM